MDWLSSSLLGRRILRFPWGKCSEISMLTSVSSSGQISSPCPAPHVSPAHLLRKLRAVGSERKPAPCELVPAWVYWGGGAELASRLCKENEAR